MAAVRPLITVFSASGAALPDASIPLPAVLTAPLRCDIVQSVFRDISKNNRQAYSVNIHAGKMPSAKSWGTGRAVARIPRVGGGGTSRSGQGAFGNMCRGGRMFAPTKTWRKWHRRVNVTLKKYAVASAIAASAVPSLVMARGHRIGDVPEVPLVVEDSAVSGSKKTSQAKDVLTAIGAYADVEKAAASKIIRAGKGKARNRRFSMRRGPLVVYAGGNEQERAFRNLPGVELCEVSRLSLIQLAPGGHMGRFVVWTAGAMASLETIYGASGKRIPIPAMTNADLGRIINSDEVQSVVKPALRPPQKRLRKKNAITNIKALEMLDPHAASLRRKSAAAQAASKTKRDAQRASKRAVSKKFKDQGSKFYGEAMAQGDVCEDGTFGL